ncbi:MAG: glycosyltransferase [Microcoleaceae cyanobacterium]
MKQVESPMVIIAGMHRSGTSLTASLLQRLGVSIGERLVGADQGNIRGHFENIAFVEFHKSILRVNGLDELGCMTQPQPLLISQSYIDQAKHLIVQNQNSQLVWGWKDPRATLFLDFWHQLLPTAKFVFVYRSPWEVVDSLYRRATDLSILESPEVAVKMWLYYNQEVLRFYQAHAAQCLLVNVYKIGEAPEQFVKAINQKFGFNLVTPPADNFEPDLLKQEILETPRPHLIKQCFPETIDLYLQLEAIAAELAGGLSRNDAQVLNDSPSLVWMFQDWSEVRKLEREINTWQDQFQDAVDRLVDAETELGRVQFQFESLEIKYEEAVAKLVTTEETLGQTQLQLEGSASQFQAALTKLTSLEQELGSTQLQLNGTQTTFQEAVTKLVATEEELGRTQRQLEEVQFNYQVSAQETLTQLSRTETDLHRTQLALATLRAEFGNQAEILRISQDHERYLTVELTEALAEIQAIKVSKIWKFREKWVSLKHSVRNIIKHEYMFNIDTPTQWEFIGNGETYTQVEGWCLHAGKQALRNVQACISSGINSEMSSEINSEINSGIFAGVYGIERQDVGDRFPGIPDSAHSGFRVQIQLPVGVHQLHLEAQDSQGKWRRFVTYSLRVWALRAAFDAPVDWQHRQGRVLFAGWCCHPEHRITQLTLHCGQHSAECAYGLRRLDVGEVLPDWVGSPFSGFEALLEVPPGTWPVTLEAQLETGEVVRYSVDTDLTIARYGVLQQGSAKLRQLSSYTSALRKRAAERQQRLGRAVPMPWELPAILRQMQSMYRQTQSPIGQAQLPQGFELPQAIDPYEAWLAANPWTERSQGWLQQRLAAYSISQLPKISVVMPVFNPPVEFLERAISSVTQQVYDNWELCIADDCSTDQAVVKSLNHWAEGDRRIHLVFRSENGNISRASNTAAKQATGEFILLLDHDDELTSNALGEIAIYLANHPETDVLYSDDDKIDSEGKRFAPQFKPEWSPELLLSYMYMGHALVVRRQLFEQVEGFRVGYEGSQDYDLALRVTEQARHIGHLPLILYHWRTAPGSTAISGAAKPASFDAGRQAIQDALQRRNCSARVDQPDWAIQQSLGIFTHQFPDEGPSVAIIIPTKNQLKLLKACLESLQKTTYQNYQVVVIDNESDDPKTLEYLHQIVESKDQSKPLIKVLKIQNQGKFNFAAINNQAVERVETDYVLFLNNDTEVLAGNWLSQMMGYAQLDQVGAVGARLIFPDDHIQHAGIIHGLHHGLAGHAFKLSHRDYFGYLAYSKVLRNYSAVTAACLLTPRKLFQELGGFDQQNFAVAYNDVDYGYRLNKAGYRCVYCPQAELLHREGTSRGFQDNPQEVAHFRRKYVDKIDPFYSPHLSLANEWFQVQPRHVRIQDSTVSIKPRVLMCTNALEYTGAPLHQYEIALKLARQSKIEPVIFCTSDGPLRHAYEQAGILVIVREHPLINVYQREQYDAALNAFCQALDLNSYDSVYANTLENFFIIDCAKRCQIPSVWNVHESEVWQRYFDGFGSEIAARALECFQFPYRIIFVADATRDLYLPLNSHHNFTVIHNGLEVNQFRLTAEQWTRETARNALEVEDQDLVILLLGTVCERKGQKDLVKALPLIPAEFWSQIRCFIVGDRPSLYSTELSELVRSLPEELRHRVAIVPETPDTPKYYQAADIFVCTSRIESYPRVILEAMAYHLPIITTPVFGIVEQVRPEVNGLFYSPEKSEELAQCLENLLGNELERERLATNAQFVLNSLNTFEEMIQAYHQIFQEAYFINPNPHVESLTLQSSAQKLESQGSESQKLGSWTGLELVKSQEQIYWEDNPMAATASEWISNPVIEREVHRRMSGGETDKYWLRWLVEDYFSGQTFDQLISLGCGIGNHEITMAKLKFARQIDAFDFSQSSVKIAQENAIDLGIQINFYQDDFNTFNLKNGKKYDIAFCSGSLHHVKELERFLAIVHQCLNPDGYFVMNEYVGDNYCIYNQKRVELINRLYSCFDKTLTSQKYQAFINPTIHQVYATDPSEAVRSRLILPFVEYFFEIELYRPFGGGILHPLYPLLDHRQFLPSSPEGETMIRLLLEFEEILMEMPGGMESDFCLCVMRPKKF